MANSDWAREIEAREPAVAAAAECGCCGRPRISLAAGFNCHCMAQGVCRRCNHCSTHCDCSDPAPEPSYAAQVIEMRWAWSQMGVRV